MIICKYIQLEVIVISILKEGEFMNVLEVKELKKKFGKREVINGISFSINEGKIFGFLGPNGAGKTTTIRMLVGLIAQNSGSISIMGHDISKDREKALANVGAVVENPELYIYLSGLENMLQVARVRKIKRVRVDEVVKMVGLSDRINDKVKKYSLGMKQRLGLGIALLSSPKLLILDEPTNGLDPSGIMDFREIVKKAAREEGMAVFISSHILTEVQQLCDTVAFISKGEIQSIEDINEVLSQKDKLSCFEIITVEKTKCINVLQELEYVKKINNGEDSVLFRCSEDMVPEIIYKLSDLRIPVRQIFEKKVGLEERYMELVEGRVRENGSTNKK